uniref:Chromosome X open reading frame 65 n=1 Tax=Pelusios castaneus TaxID=367368 RepID=A0A8C8RX31_9SAUR
MFICVRHGENQQFLANTCCSVLLLLHYLRSKVGLRRTDAIDLCDELGTLKLLFLVKLPSDSASKFLSPRGIYYVCRVQRGAPGSHFSEPSLPLSADALRTQCEFLEKSRLKLLKAQDGKKIQTMESSARLPPWPLAEETQGAGLSQGESKGHCAVEVSLRGAPERSECPEALRPPRRGICSPHPIRVGNESRRY